MAILFLVFFMEMTGDYTASKSINNSLLYNIGWVYLESVLLIFYFYTLEIDALVKKKIRLITISIMTWGLGNTLFFQDITSTFQFFSFLPFAIAIIILSVHFLSKILNLKIFAERNILSVPHFWIVCALLFFCEAVLLFGTYQFYPKPIIENVALLFNFNRLIAGIMYLTFGLSFFIPFFLSRRNSSAF